MFIGFFVPMVQVNAQGVNTTNQAVSSSSSACDAVKGIGNIICKIHQILSSVVPVLMALGMIYFVWGVVTYMIGGAEEDKKKGREKIIYSLVGFAVIVGVWGLVNIIITTFDLGGTSVPGLGGVATGSCPSLSTISNPNLQNLLQYITCLITNSVVPLIFALALVMFIWGVVQYVINSDEEAKKEKGRQFMIWGIIALTVMVSVWGLVRVLGDTFGIDSNFIPQVKSTSTSP
jgi:hypothetical protein